MMIYSVMISFYCADWGDYRIAMQFSHILTSILNNALWRFLVILLVKLAFSSP
jgi:hypothetical protein